MVTIKVKTKPKKRLRTRHIQVRTKYSTFDDVPDTDWSGLRAYWDDIIASIIEVLLEGEFNISIVRKTNPDGFIASTPYWQRHAQDPKRYPLKEAKRFISCLKGKSRFTVAIASFNRGYNTNWLLEDKVATLGGFLCSWCSPLLDYLRALKL